MSQTKYDTAIALLVEDVKRTKDAIATRERGKRDYENLIVEFEERLAHLRDVIGLLQRAKQLEIEQDDISLGGTA